MSDRLRRLIRLQQQPQFSRFGPAREVSLRPRRCLISSRQLTSGARRGRREPQRRLVRGQLPTRPGSFSRERPSYGESRATAGQSPVPLP